MDAAQLAREIQAAGLDVPVVVLAYDYREIKNFVARNPSRDIERIFLWQGNVRILIAIVKYIEDKRNVQHDTAAMGVPVILVVEDNIRYYSSFLPVIYTELIYAVAAPHPRRNERGPQAGAHAGATQDSAGSNYEDAAQQVMQYRDYLLGVVSDVEFPRGGELSAEAGFELARMVRDAVPDVPIVLQSSRTEFIASAHMSERLLVPAEALAHAPGDLRQFLIEQFGFGDFVFRLPDAPRWRAPAT